MRVMIAPHTRRRILYRVFIGLAAVFMLGVITDSLIAARTEYRISQALYRSTNLPTPPAVQVTGFPYVAAVWTHELQSVTVTARDVEVPGWGLMSVHSSAQYVTIPPDAVFTGEINQAPARKVFTRLELDGVSIGSKMKIDDLQIQNRDDISPRGGWETEAVFEGTPAGFAEPASVEMKLRVKEGQVYLSPTKIIEGPMDHSARADRDADNALPQKIREEITEAFKLKIDTTTLPLRGKPIGVYASGGRVLIESEQYYTTVSIKDLAPYTLPLEEDEEPGL